MLPPAKSFSDLPVSWLMLPVSLRPKTFLISDFIFFRAHGDLPPE
jgi:hypothetical protein